MPVLRQLCGYCWISLLFFLPICTSDKTKNISETKQVFRNVIYNFSETQNTWIQAKRACKENRGTLARIKDSETLDFLKKISADLSGPAWWVGEGMHEFPSQSESIGKNEISIHVGIFCFFIYQARHTCPTIVTVHICRNYIFTINLVICGSSQYVLQHVLPWSLQSDGRLFCLCHL